MTSDKASMLIESALTFLKEGKESECAEALAIAGGAVLSQPVNEEKPRELCRIARLFLEIRQPEEAREVLRSALTVLEDVKGENPWKYTNGLCYVADGLRGLGKKNREVTAILDGAIVSLAGIDAHYGKRKAEIVSLLKRLSEDEKVRRHERFMLEPGTPSDCSSGLPFEQTMDFLTSFIYLSPEDIGSLESLGGKNAALRAVPSAISRLEERWRQAVALAILARLFLGCGRPKDALAALALAEGHALDIEFYWVRDNAREVISGTYLEAFSWSPDGPLLKKARVTARAITDPWKQARAHCRIAEALIKEKRFKEAAQELNHVHSHLLGRIDYRDRTAMSMLLIAEVFDSLGESRANSLFSIFNPDKRRVTKLRRDAFSILDSLDPDKKKESLEEYKEFISLRSRG